MSYLLCPGHLGDMNEPLDAFLDFNECAVIGQADNLAPHLGLNRVLLLGLGPRIIHKLLESKGHSLAVTVETEDLHLYLVADLKHFRRMSHPAPTHVGNVQQPVDPAKVHENTVIGDILYYSVNLLVVLEGSQGK